MWARLVIVMCAVVVGFFANAKYSKKQDGDYVREYCAKVGGRTYVRLPNRDIPDCTTDRFVMEIDSAPEWEFNLRQALRYGNRSTKKAKLVLVVEERSQIAFFKAAQNKIKKQKLPVELDKIENFKSRAESLAEIKRPAVIMSETNKCHVKGCGYYAQTKHFKKGFSDLASCLNAGGSFAGRMSEARYFQCEIDATGCSSQDQVRLSKVQPATSLEKVSDENPNVKFTMRSGHCHARGERSYNQTKNFLPFQTMADCHLGQKHLANGTFLVWYRKKFGA